MVRATNMMDEAQISQHAGIHNNRGLILVFKPPFFGSSYSRIDS